MFPYEFVGDPIVKFSLVKELCILFFPVFILFKSISKILLLFEK